MRNPQSREIEIQEKEGVIGKGFQSLDPKNKLMPKFKKNWMNLT